MAGMARAKGATLTRAQKCLAEKKCYLQFLNLHLAPHTTTNCKAAPTQRTYLQ